MRTHWFHLMPYQNLPSDFSTTYPSVWVTPPSSLNDPVAGHRMYNEYLDELEFADQMGFDGICVNEHHQNAYGLMPSPNLMAAALARRTEDAAIVVLGNSIALYNPPTRVAAEFAMLDCLSGGRLVAGFPVGTSMDTNFCYGQVPATLREKYDEAHDLIMQAWTRDDVFSFNGKYTQLRYVNVWPKPIQKPHPPIWIPGGGSAETWEWCARQDYVYAALSFAGYIRGKGSMEGFWEELERQGKPFNPYHGGFAQILAVSETDEKAEKEFAPHADYFFNNCLHIPPTYISVPGYRSVESTRMSFTKQVAAFGAGPGQAKRKSSWKELVDGGNIIVGSPATVRDRLREAIKGLRVGHMLLLMQFGDMPPHLVNKSSELFAKEVMPHLKDLWGDYEDRWWPAPMQQRVEPRPTQRVS